MNRIYCKLEHTGTKPTVCFSRLLSLVSFASFGLQTVGSQKAVGRDHQAAFWLLPLSQWWLLRFLHVPFWYSQCLAAGRHPLIHSLASPHVNLPWQEHHAFCEPSSTPSTCCCCHPHQQGTKHQRHPWRKCRHTDGSPGHSREWVPFCISAALAESRLLLFFWKM